MNQSTTTMTLPNYGAPAGGRGFVNHPYFKNELHELHAINNAGLPEIDQIPAPEYGYTLSDLLNEKLMRKFILGVIQMNYSVGHLSVPPLVDAMMWPHRRGIFAMAPLFEVHSNVGEAETVPLTTAKFESVEVSMTKSVLKMGISDEMKLDSRDSFISPRDYMQTRMGEAFAYELDKQVLEQLQNKPMKYLIDLTEPQPPEDRKPIKELIEKVFPYIIGSFLRSQHSITGVAVNPTTWAYLQGLLNREYHGMAMYREGVFPLMQNVDVCPCSLVPETKMYFVSNNAPGIMVLTHPEIIGHGFDDVDTATEVQRVDVYRQVFSNILTRDFKPIVDVHQDPEHPGAVSKEIYTANAGVFELELKGMPWVDPEA